MNINTINEAFKIFKNGWNGQIILYGPPGTSKTYSSTILAAALLSDASEEDICNESKLKTKLGGESTGDIFEIAKTYLEQDEIKTRYKLVQFHPSYSYEDFVRGITVKTDGGTVTYEVESKIIEEFSKGCSEGKPKVLVIDEINRAPLASVLGELIYGLEYRDQVINTSYELKSKEPLKIPKGLYIIGTMNTADRSIGSMDYAVRRRFAFISVPSEPNSIISSWTDANVGKCALSLYNELIANKNGIFDKDLIADKELDVDDIKIGHTYFLGKKSQGLDYLLYRIMYQIWPIYSEYIKDGLISDPNLAKQRFAECIRPELQNALKTNKELLNTMNLFACKNLGVEFNYFSVADEMPGNNKDEHKEE